MTTPTKPKRPIDVSTPQLHLTKDEREALLECARIPFGSDAGEAFLSLVTRRLSWHAEMLRRAPERSLPAHTRAALVLIIFHAGALMPFLDPAAMPKEVGAELTRPNICQMLDVHVADTYTALFNIKAAAEEGVERLAPQGGPGQLKRLQSETREQALRELEGIHRKLSVECEDDDGYLREFLDRCAKHLET